MADSKKCDRCGKYYDKNETKARCKMKGTKANMSYIDIRTVMNNYDQTYDLCDDCFEKLYDFLDHPEKDEGGKEECKKGPRYIWFSKGNMDRFYETLSKHYRITIDGTSALRTTHFETLIQIIHDHDWRIGANIDTGEFALCDIPNADILEQDLQEIVTSAIEWMNQLRDDELIARDMVVPCVIDPVESIGDVDKLAKINKTLMAYTSTITLLEELDIELSRIKKKILKKRRISYDI